MPIIQIRIRFTFNSMVLQGIFSYTQILFFCLLISVLPTHFVQAQDTVTSLVDRLKTTEGVEKADLLNSLAKTLENSLPVKAREYAQRAVDLSRSLGYDLGEAQALKNIGVIYLLQGNYTQALEYFLNALKIYESINDPAGTAETLNNVGTVYQNLQKFDIAKEYYHRVIELDKKTNNREGQASTLNNLGDIFYQEDRYEEALSNYRLSLKIREDQKNESGIAESLMNIGVVLYSLGSYDESLDYFNRSYQMDSLLLNKANQSITLGNIAKTNLKLGDIDKAFFNAQKSLLLAEEINLKVQMVNASEILSDIYATQQRFDQAYEQMVLHQIIEEELFSEENAKIINDLQTSYELEKKQKEIDLLNKDRFIRGLIIAAAVVGLVLLLLLAFILYRANRNKRLANSLLRLQNAEIIQQKEEILAQRDAIEAQRDQIETQHREIVHKTQNIESSIQYALRIQQAMLPYDDTINQELPLHFIFYKPRDLVSGDFYWYASVDQRPHLSARDDIREPPSTFTTQSHKKVIFTAIDCTGHGVPGAFMSMIGDALLNQIVMDKRLTEPNLILNEMHWGIRKALKQSETHNRDGMDMTLCVIDKESKTIEFAGAKNPLIYVKNNELTEVKTDVFSVGGWLEADDKPRNYKKHQISYADAPITLYMFTDGYQDQFGGPKNKKFMRKRFRELLFKIHQEPMAYQRDILDKTFHEWTGEQRQMDDILVIGLKLA